jgi:putative DNA primase/helicase
MTQDTTIVTIESLGPDPWYEPVSDIAGVWTRAGSAIAKRVAASQVIYDTAVLWAQHTHFVHHAHISLPLSPRLIIGGKEPICGKTTLLHSLCPLVWRPLPVAASLTPAVVRLALDKYQTTLMLDEIEHYLRTPRSKVGRILQASYQQQTADIMRNVQTANGRWELQFISVWGALAYTAANKPSPGLRSQAISLTLSRARLDAWEQLAQPEDPLLELPEPGRKFARWAQDQTELPEASIPEGLDARASDNWRPLLQIAALAGGDWPQRAAAAATALAGN